MKFSFAEAQSRLTQCVATTLGLIGTLVALGVLGVAACSAATPPPPAHRVLRVALYPFIPDRAPLYLEIQETVPHSTKEKET